MISDTPYPGEHFHVPNDPMIVHEISELVMTLKDPDGIEWLVRTSDGTYFILNRDDAVQGIAFRGRPAPHTSFERDQADPA